MPTFTPPKVKDNPPILPDSTGLERRLWRYFPNRARYVLVFKLSDGTFVQDTATAENSNTNIPYPYNPYDPSAPYSTSYYINFEVNPPVPTVSYVSQNPYIAKVYMNVSTVTSAEATALTNAGYGACIMYPPTIGSVTVNSTTSVTVNWTAPSLGTTPTGYTVSCFNNPEIVPRSVAYPATSVTLSGSFTKGQSCKFVVSAYTSLDISELSNPSTAVVPNP